MEKDTARKVLEMLINSNNKLNEALIVVKNECPEGEFIEFRSEIANVMGSIFIDLMRPIHRAHPELEPEQIKAAIEEGRKEAEDAKLKPT